ncbi:Alkyl hydroperoxide reductase subunit F [Escovopsis weberi]|uniref:Alkyl hydroperoxide reductase subunit F n=1 Tax=Escovopsis weberi TaxID=150374 RepID=A0A0M9VRV2_ESCWE|nr:Alkyl hydroperoxide reductase subunit F [Escovopsis weberi]
MKVSTLSILPAVALAAPGYRPTPGPAVRADYDAIVVGGGPAGLSAASGLARVRRNVLLIDSGEYRNGPTRHMHDVIGLDGLTGEYFRWSARNQIDQYETATLVNGTVNKITPQANNTYFTIESTYPGGNAVSYTARKVVLATGLRDLLPETPGIQENWGKGIYWCPWCDGHEHEDQALGIIGPLSQGPTTVREILTLNEDIVLLVNGTDTPEMRANTTTRFPGWEKYLDLHGISVENRTITSIERLRNGTVGEDHPELPSNPEHDLFQVNFSTGEPLLRNAFLTNFQNEQRSSLGEKSGVKLIDGRLTSDIKNGYISNIPGIYAIGDANSDDITNVPHAMFSGKRCAVSLHVKLEVENSDAQLGALNQKRDMNAHMRSVWERMNVPGDLLDAGEYDP